MHPMFGLDGASVDPYLNDFRPRLARQTVPQASGCRRKAAVEPDLKEGAIICFPGRNYGVKAIPIKRQRLFHQDMLAGGQRLGGERRMGVMPCRNYYRVDSRIVENGGWVCFGVIETEGFLAVLCAGATLCDNGVEMSIRRSLDRR